MLESNRLKDQPESGRPRERLAREGADALSNAELVAILLRTGLKGTNVVEVAQQVLNKFRTLRELANASLDELRTVKGIGRDKAVTLLAAFALARKMARELQIDSPPLDSPEAIATLLRDHVSFRETETLHVILLNTRRRLINIYKIADGTLDTLLVHSREVFREAIRQNASAIVLAHPRTSSVPERS
ncbi:MAG: DNA repair protein RadC [Verrucomicrobia bacterium]|nr:DNA repair protein RadC [Verrucomicrobiota bacterium]